MLCKILSILFIAIFFVIFPQNSFAASEFSNAYDVSYDVSSDGITNALEKVTVTNLTDTYFVSSFTMTIGSTTLSDISASDEGGKMEINVENKNNQTIIRVKFNRQITGLEKKQSFTLNYKSKDFTQKIGKTWEVNLPKIQKDAETSSFNETLSVPLSFGEPISITPKPITESDRSGKIYFTFNKDQLEKNGVSVNFGTNQIFDFKLKYFLKNTSFLSAIASIALPPDTNYQDISILSLQPKPLNVTVDKDGNYLAWYQIPKRSDLEIEASGSAKLYIEPKNKKVKALSDSEIKEFTKSDKYWEKDNPAIKAVLKEIFKEGEPKNNHDKAKLVYQYVVNTLSYDPTRLNNLERMGAVTALNNPQNAVCMEFTDLFITLARAAEIPARELQGYAYTQNKNLRPLSLKQDLLHSWPEYFDGQLGWVMVDPTWENTSGGVDYFNKFDLNHLSLAINGVSSGEPGSPDLAEVIISEADFNPVVSANVEIKINKNLWAGFPSTAEIRITNNGSETLKPSPLKIFSSNVSLLDNQLMYVSSIPPKGYASFNVDLKGPFFWQTTEGSITVNYLEHDYSKQVTIKPFFFFIPIPYAFFSIIGLVVFGYLAVLLIHYLRKKNI